MKAFGGTCPMCCGDLDTAPARGSGAAVCLFCHYTAPTGETGGRDRPSSGLALPVLAAAAAHPRRAAGPITALRV